MLPSGIKVFIILVDSGSFFRGLYIIKSEKTCDQEHMHISHYVEFLK